MVPVGLRAVDLFSGCGGMSLGLARAGFEVVGAFDAWDKALECYRKNLPHPAFRADLSRVEEAVALIAPLGPDLVAGGPPCQDFSQAGRRKEGERADLTVAFAEIVARLRPVAFLMENVDTTPKSQAYAKARGILKAAGYGLTEEVLDASLCGVPQRRRRFFAIGVLGEKNGFLSFELLMRLSSRPLTVREAFGDLGFRYYYRHPRTYGRRGIFSVDEPAPTVRGVLRPMPPGYRRHPEDPVEPGPWVRSLEVRDIARFQGFPDGWVWPEGKSLAAQLIGNAVPPPMAKLVAEALLRHLESIGRVRKEAPVEEGAVALFDR